jgi:hypothetical protein
MAGLRTWQTGVFAALMLVGAAGVAALFAHVGIDVLGDFVLAHDAYDGVDHRSRSEVVALAVTLVLAALLRAVWGAFDEARTGRVHARPTFEDVFGRGPWRFVIAVAVLTLPALAAMEAFDVLGTGGRIDDFADLVGGSVPLALGVTIPTAILAALATRALARFIMHAQRGLVAVIGRLIALIARADARHFAPDAASDHGDLQAQRSILSRRFGKRGPPQPAH